MEIETLKISELAGREFCKDIFLSIDKNHIKSPIEQAFLIYLKSVIKINKLDNDKALNIKITPQFIIGKYRCDFKLSLMSFSKIKSEIIIELDSKQFHDRTEQERSYEKERDRFIQKSGYKIFRYTGADVLKNKKNITTEIIRYLLEETK